MKFALSNLRVARVTLLAGLMLAGCASPPGAGVQAFSSGVLAAKSQTDAAFQAVTDLSGEAIIDYAAAQPVLTDADFLPVLDPQALATWDQAFLALQKYAQELVLLTSPTLTTNFEAAATTLGSQVKQLGGDLNSPQAAAAMSSLSPSLAAGFTELGDLLLRAKARGDAGKVFAQSDPVIRRIFMAMTEAIGSSNTNDLRGTVHAHWEQQKAKLKVAFLEAKPVDRRDIAAQYAVLLSGQTTQDLALASLQRSLLALADVHHGLAGGRSQDVAAALGVIEQEAQNTQNLVARLQGLPKTSANH